jgi:hypothetical protein
LGIAEDFGVGAAKIVAIQQRDIGKLTRSDEWRSELERIGGGGGGDAEQM